MLAINKRFMTSVSTIALTTAMALVGSTTQTQAIPPTSANGVALPGANSYVSPTAITSVQSVEDEGNDPSNAVSVTGIVYGTALFPHLNAIGVNVFGWDIEASGANDFELSVATTFGATATNLATVTGQITGVAGNVNFAPGSNSVGVLVADDIETKSAWAFASYFGPGAISQTAVAQNTNTVLGTVAGSSTLSTGLSVGDAIRAGDFPFQDGAFAGVGVTGDSGFGSAHALNAVSVTGSVGGTGASPGSIGVEGGTVYATNALAGGESIIYVPQVFPFPVFGAASVTGVNGSAVLDLLASNAVGIDGSVNLDGGDGAIGVRILNDVFALGSAAFGEAISIGAAEGISTASGILISTDSVTITGAGNGLEFPNTGVDIGGQVSATYASAIGEAISGTFGNNANSRIEVRANDVVSIVGTAGEGNVGVSVGEGVHANFAEAYGYAAANPGQSGNVANAFAEIVIDGGNTVQISGTATGDYAVGFQMGAGPVEGYYAVAEGVVSAYATNSGSLAATDAVATAEGSVTAHNGISITGTVTDTVSNGVGVDPILYVEAFNASAGGGFFATAVSNNVTGGATATVTGNVLANNAVDVTGVVGLSGSISTGVEISGYVAAYDAYATGDASSSATANNTGISAGATANTSLMVQAINSATVSGGVGDFSTGSTGVAIGQDVGTETAFAEGNASAFATVNGSNTIGSGGNAYASAVGTVNALNLVSVAGTVGAEGSGNTGVSIGSYLLYPVGLVSVDAQFAEAYGRTTAAAEAGSGVNTTSTAIANGTVLASNAIQITGNVGASGTDNIGVFAESSVFAGFAEAGGIITADAELQNRTTTGSSALAQAEGSIIAQNMVSIVGEVGSGSFDYNSTGVHIGEGVSAQFAEANGYVNASASMPNGGNGSVTANTSGTIGAQNLIGVGGTVGASGSGNTGVWIGEGVSAYFAEAGYLPFVPVPAPPGFFGADATHLDGTTGDATASIGDAGGEGGPNRAEVYANNQVAIQGVVSDSTSLNPGSNNTGVYIGTYVEASFAEANGYFSASATRNGPNNGNADASTYASVSALNSIALGGSVGQYNSGSTGLIVDNLTDSSIVVGASFAEATGYASSYANRNDAGAGNATAYTDLVVSAINQIGNLTGSVGPEGSNNTGLRIDGSVEAFNAFAEGTANASASRTGTGAGAGNATATALLDVQGVNSIAIGGQVGDYNSGSYGVAISGDVAAYGAAAFAESNAYTYIGNPTGSGPNGTQTAVANATADATNTITITGSVGSYVTNSVGVDPTFVSASNIVGPGYNAYASAFASATGPEGGTAGSTATASSLNDIGMVGTVADHTTGSTGINVINGVSATGAAAEASAGVSVDNQNYYQVLTGTATANATARNKVDVEGGVGTYSSNDYGVNIGGDVTVGDLKIEVATDVSTAADTHATATAVATGLMENVVNLTGSVGNDSGSSTGVHVGGNVLFNGGVSTTSDITSSGNYSSLMTIEGFNRSTIMGQVGSNSSNSYGVWIGGNVQATNALVSNFVIAGSDSTDNGTTRGVYIGGSVLTGDAEDSQLQSGSWNNLLPAPIIPPPTQVGDYVELAGSVFIGANAGVNPYGVDVAGGNDTVLVRDTHFQMDVVNGFNGGSNPDRDGQDVITFNNAQIYVSNLDNFERLNVTNQSFVILTNPDPYAYSVKDYSPSNMTAQVNIDNYSVLSFGDGGTTPPVPEVSVPVNSLTLNTEILTIGGVNGVKTVGPDDSILKAENNGTGSYTINAVIQRYDDSDLVGTVNNFGTITLSKVLSAERGTDPHGIFYNSSTSFDSPSEQLYWATHGSWTIDPSSGAGDVLTINGNYNAGSDLILDTYVFKTGSPSDKLVVNGEVAGTTTVWVNNTNTTGTGHYTGHGPTDGMLLVDVNNGTQTPGDVSGTFVLGNTSGWNWADPVHFPINEMQVGAFVYTLQQAGTDGKDFYLQSNLLDQVPGYAAASTALQQHFYAELGTLYQRLGELRHGDVAPRDNTKVEFWMRGVGEKNTVSPSSGFGFDQTTYGFMIGGDYLWRNAIADKSRLHIGGFFGYGKSKVDNVDGASGDASLKTDGWTVGAYATYFDTSRLGQGLYIDAVLKANFMSTDYSSSSRHTSASNNDFAWGASLEAGYGIGLGGGFIIQPQGQLTYMQVTADNFDESSTPGIPLSIDRAAADSLRGRLGLQLQNTWTNGTTQFSPYLIGNVIHEFQGNNKTTVAGTSFRSDMGGTWYNAGGGLTVDFGNLGVYGHVEYTFGGNVEGIGGGLGLKYRW